jgi:hypothetical protein
LLAIAGLRPENPETMRASIPARAALVPVSDATLAPRRSLRLLMALARTIHLLLAGQ